MMSGMQPHAFTVEVDGLRLVGEQVVPAGAHVLLVLCHGIPSGNPPDPADPGYAGLASDLASHGYGAVWFNFRGSRSSPGNFSAQGWCRDLGAVADLLARQHDLPLVAIASSAGGATAIVAAAESGRFEAVATLAAVASLRETGLLSSTDALLQRFRNAGIIRDPAFPSDRDAWLEEFDQTSALDHIGRISPKPVLLVHGTADDVVPYHHAELLFEGAKAPKELVRIEGGGHQLRRDPRAIDAVLEWLGRLGFPPGHGQ